jgi:hypothetical protein
MGAVCWFQTKLDVVNGCELLEDTQIKVLVINECKEFRLVELFDLA